MPPGGYTIAFTDQVSSHVTGWWGADPDIGYGATLYVVAGRSLSGIDGNLVLGGSIAGTVTNTSAQPIAGICASIYEADAIGGTPDAGGCTDSNGHYQTGGLPPGPYVAVFDDPVGPYLSSYNYSTPIVVQRAAITTGANATLSLGGTISGTVTAATGGAPVAGVCVTVTPSFGQPRCTDAAGHYQSPGLPSGTYTVEFDASASGFRTQWYNAQSSGTTATPVTVTQGTPTSGINAALASGGAIAGTVKDAVSNAAIAGVTVTATGAGTSRSAMTDATGVYRIGGLGAGSYSVEFDDNSGAGHLSQWYSGSASQVGATPVTVTATATTSGINAALTPGGTITGTVTDSATHSGIGGVTVSASRFGAIAYATTDGSGGYSIPGLSAGSYTVGFADEYGGGHLPEWYPSSGSALGATPVPVTAGATASNVNVAMLAGGSISGTVTDSATHSGLARIEVTASTFGFAASAVTDGSGTFSVRGLPAGAYTVDFRDAGNSGHVEQWYSGSNSQVGSTPVVVSLGADTANINAALTGGTGAISGTVTDGAHAPVAGVTLSSGGPSYATATSDASGAFTLTGLLPGSYTVTSRDSLARYADKQSGAITVQSGVTTTGVALSLLPTGAIAGTVTDAATHQPVVNALVSANLNDFYSNYAYTGIDGTYKIVGLDAGSYPVSVSAADANYQPFSFSQPITVQTGATTTGVDAQLTTGARIIGTVTDQSTHAPLEDVNVYASNGTTSYTASTDASGNYQLQGLVTGSYIVEFSATPYLLQWYNGASYDSATPVVLNSITTVSGVNAALVAGGSISGTVTDATTHQPLAGIYVQAQDDNYDQGFAQTDTLGRYSIPGLPSGSYTVSFEDESSQRYLSSSTASPVAVTAPGAKTGVDAALAAGGSISGTVTDSASHLALQSARVQVYDSGGNFVNSTHTDGSGRYAVTGLATGNYTVSFEENDADAGYLPQWFNKKSTQGAATPVSVTAGNTASAIDASLVKGGTITGTVTDASTHAPVYTDVEVYVAGQTDPVDSTYTDGAGKYRINGLAGGAYQVQFGAYSNTYVSQWYKNRSTRTTADPVNVATGMATNGIDAAMVGGGRIQGTVTDSISHAPLGGMQVAVYLAGATTPVQQTFTASDGTYSAGGLAAGTYQVKFSDEESQYVTQWYNNQSSQAAATSVSVTLGAAATGVDAKLVPNGAITGKVTASTGGAALGGIQVTLYDSNQSQIRYTTTASDGTYSFSGLGTANYTVEFVDPNSQYITQWYNNEPDSAHATAVHTAPGAPTAGINAHLALGATITGTVTDASTHLPIKDVGVAVYPQNSFDSIGYGGTDAAGKYSIGGLPAGTYVVSFYDASRGGHLDQWYNGRPDAASADPITLAASATKTGVDAALVTGGSINGTVTDSASKPVANIYVTAFQHSTQNEMAEAVTGPGGTYALVGLPAGSYDVVFNQGNDANLLAQWYDHEPDQASANPVAVTLGAATNDINAALDRAGSLSGTVTDKASGTPIDDLCVNVFAASSIDIPVDEACTDSAGHYQVAGLPTGNYLVDFDDSSGAPTPSRTRYVSQWYNNQVDGQHASPVSVHAGIDVPGVDAALAAGGTISGTVLKASDGTPLGNAEVWITDLSGNLLEQTPAYSDSTGAYQTGGLAAGTYKVFVEHPYESAYFDQWYDNKATVDAADVVTVTVGSNTTLAAANMQIGGTINGTISDAATSSGISGGCAYVYDTSDAFVTSGCADNSGRYQSGGLIAGTYKVRFGAGGYLDQWYNAKTAFASADPVTVVAQQETGGIDADMSSGAGFTGTVIDAATHAPIQNVCVTARSNSFGTSNCFWTDVTGRYTASGLPADSYSVNFSPYYSKYLSQNYPTQVSATLGSVIPNINAQLTLGGTVSGQVTDVSNGAPLSNICIDVNNIGTGDYLYSDTCTDSSGHFTTMGLAAGNYEVQYTNYGGRFINEWYDNQPTQSGAKPIAVTLGHNTANINAALALGGNVTGTVTDAATHTPISGICVTIDTTSGAFAGNGGCSDASGHWSSAGLPQGSYKVQFKDPSSVHAMQWYKGRLSLATADLVAVTVGATTSGINAALGMLPGAPTGVSGLPGNSQATVSWTAPTSTGGSPITSYTVTSTPGGATCKWASGPLSCVVKKLTNATPYTFTVKATTAFGTGPASTASAPVTPTSGSVTYTIGLTAKEQARLQRVAAYYGTTPATVFKTGVYFLSYINTIAPSQGPTPVTLPPAGTATTISVSWDSSELPVLQVVMRQYVLNAADANRYGYYILDFIAGLTGH